MSHLLIQAWKLGYIQNVQKRKNDNKLRMLVKDIFSDNFKLDLNLKTIDRKTPSLILANYCSDRLENIACIMIPCDVAIMMRDTLKNIMKLDKLIKWPIYTKESGSYDSIKKQIQEHTDQGRSVFCYITKYPRHRPDYIPIIRSGMFKIAKELGIPITPLCIDTIDNSYGIIPYQRFGMISDKTFMVNDITDSQKRVKDFYIQNLRKFREKKYKNI